MTRPDTRFRNGSILSVAHNYLFYVYCNQYVGWLCGVPVANIVLNLGLKSLGKEIGFHNSIMPIEIVPYTSEHEEGVRAFNLRLAAAGLDPNQFSQRFPESHIPQWLPKRDGCDLFQEYFVALDEHGIVRGGYILKHQNFQIRGNLMELAAYQLPISEGVFNRDFSILGVTLYRDALRRHPRLWGLGGGGLDSPAGKFMRSAGWHTTPVPFWFRVVNPNAFMRNISFLRTSLLRSTALECLRCSGLGWLGLKAAFLARGHQHLAPDVSAEMVPAFTGWTDEVWDRCRAAYSLVAVRDSAALGALYPTGNSRFIRLKISKGPRVLGWAVLLNTPMSGHKHFGDMRVGTLVDCLASPEDAADVVACSRRVLEEGGADLVLSNQAARVWCQVLRCDGFMEGSTNFPFFMSPRLADLLQPLDENVPFFHLNRGDGDGPINL